MVAKKTDRQTDGRRIDGILLSSLVGRFSINVCILAKYPASILLLSTILLYMMIYYNSPNKPSGDQQV